MHETELKHRIRGAWAKFMEHKQELTGRHYSLNSRLKLFDAIVSPTILYGAECWTFTKRLENILQTTQRRMLRLVLGRGRRRVQNSSQDEEDLGSDVQSNVSEKTQSEAQVFSEGDDLEPWVEWIQRVTHEAEASLARLKIKTWVQQARRRKWKWAAKVICNCAEDRWARLAFEWDPRKHFDAPKPSARRRPSRPNARWFDEIDKFFTETLPQRELTKEMQVWIDYEEQFVNRDQPLPAEEM